MKKYALQLFALSILALGAQGETLAGWNFYGLIGDTSISPTQQATTVHANIGPVVASLGAGQNTGGATSGIPNQWNTRGRAITLEGAIQTNTYMTFTITPQVNFAVTVTNVSYIASYSTRVATGTLFSAVSGFTLGDQVAEGVPPSVGSATSPALCTIPVPGGVTITNSTEFRIYFTSTSASTATIRYGDSDTDIGNTCILIEGTSETTQTKGTTIIFN